MKKFLLTSIIALGAAAAFAGEPQVVFDIGDGSRDVVKLADIQRCTFLPTALRVQTAEVKDYPYESLTAVRFDLAGVTPTGVKDVEAAASALRAFPSPAKNTISVAGVTDGVFEIYATDGRRVARVTDYDGSAIDISPLESGVYIIKTKAASTKFFKL